MCVGGEQRKLTRDAFSLCAASTLLCCRYFNNDRDVLAEIITSRNDDSGRFYFDKNEIKRFATFRKMGRASFELPGIGGNIPGGQQRGEAGQEGEEEDSFHSISLRSGNSEDGVASSQAKSASLGSHASRGSGGGDSDNKVWWTPDELHTYIRENPDDFKWLNPLRENSPGQTRSFSD